MAQGVNTLVGNVMYQPAAGSQRDATEVMADGANNMVGGLFSGSGTDGTELAVGVIVLTALAVLIMFRVGGFKAVIAS